MPIQRKKGTWLTSYADLMTLLLTAFLLSVVLINELENSLFMTVDYLLSEGKNYLDGSNIESFTDLNGNNKYDIGEPLVDCDFNVCSDSPEWEENMGNGIYDKITLDGIIDNKSNKLKMNIERPIGIRIDTKGLELVIQSDKMFKVGLAEIKDEAKRELCLLGKIVSDAIKLEYIDVPVIYDSITTYYTIDSLRRDLAYKCQKITEKIKVEGHTDNTPITKKLAKKWYNQTNSRLSAARALSIVEFWFSNSCNKYKMPLDLKEKWFTTAGMGEHSPIASNGTPEGKEKNRRVEIFIDIDIEIDSTLRVSHKNNDITCVEFLKILERNTKLQ